MEKIDISNRGNIQCPHCGANWTGQDASVRELHLIRHALEDIAESLKPKPNRPWASGPG